MRLLYIYILAFIDFHDSLLSSPSRVLEAATDQHCCPPAAPCCLAVVAVRSDSCQGRQRRRKFIPFLKFFLRKNKIFIFVTLLLHLIQLVFVALFDLQNVMTQHNHFGSTFHKTGLRQKNFKIPVITIRPYKSSSALMLAMENVRSA